MVVVVVDLIMQQAVMVEHQVEEVHLRTQEQQQLIEVVAVVAVVIVALQTVNQQVDQE